MTARLSAKEAKQLGLPGVDKTTPRKKGKKRDRSTVPAKECAPNRCATCGEVMAGETAEQRHAKETGHLRFESVLEFVDG